MPIRKAVTLVCILLLSKCGHACADYVFSSEAQMICSQLHRDGQIYIGKVLSKAEVQRPDLEGLEGFKGIKRPGQFGYHYTLSPTEVFTHSAGDGVFIGDDCNAELSIGNEYLIGEGWGPEGLGAQQVNSQPWLIALLRAWRDHPEGSIVVGSLYPGKSLSGNSGIYEGQRIRIHGPNFDRWTTTGKSSSFYFAGVPPGKYVISAPGSGAVPAFVNVSGADKCVQAPIKAGTGQISGGLVAKGDDPDVSEVDVELIRVLNDHPVWPSLSIDSDNDGKFEFKDVPPGNYVIGVNVTKQPSYYSAYRKTFYPSASDITVAAPVVVDPGAIIAGLNIFLDEELSALYMKVIAVDKETHKPVPHVRFLVNNLDYPDAEPLTAEIDSDQGIYVNTVTGMAGYRYSIRPYVRNNDGSATCFRELPLNYNKDEKIAVPLLDKSPCVIPEHWDYGVN